MAFQKRCTWWPPPPRTPTRPWRRSTSSRGCWRCRRTSSGAWTSSPRRGNSSSGARSSRYPPGPATTRRDTFTWWAIEANSLLTLSRSPSNIRLAQKWQTSIDVHFFNCTKWHRRGMPSSSNAIMRNNIIGVLLVHGSSEPCVLFVTCWTNVCPYYKYMDKYMEWEWSTCAKQWGRL